MTGPQAEEANETAQPATRKVAERVAGLPSIRAFLADADLQAKKSLGQNFLFDLNLTGRIAASASSLSGTIIEIGPGPGGLTRALLMAGAEQLIAVEKDRRAIEFLGHLQGAAGPALQLVEQDALTFPAWQAGQRPRRIIANLPYNIATPLLISWLSHAADFDELILLFQKEVAERITACPGSSQYGRLSVLASWRAESRLLFDIPPEAFSPPPKVTSSLVQLRPRPAPLHDCRQQDLEWATQTAFGQRRKMLRASFKKYGGAEMLERLGIDPQMRPQELDIGGFCKLANARQHLQNS